MLYLRIVTLASHLLCVNLASAGPILCVWLEWMAFRQGGRRGARPAQGANGVGEPEVDRPAADGPIEGPLEGPPTALLHETARQLAKASLLALQAGVLLGIASGLLLAAQQRDQFFQAAALLKWRLIWGVGEIGFAFACLLAYLAWYRWAERGTRAKRVVHRLLALAAATNLLFHFPPLFSILSEISHAPSDAPLTSAQYRQWLLDPLILAKVFHVWGASFAVAGLAVSFLAKSAVDAMNARGAFQDEHATELRARGALVALLGTVAQLPTGLWLLFQLPPNQQYALFGADMFATALLGLSVLLTFNMLNRLTQAAFGEPTHRQIVITMLHGVTIVVAMVAVLIRLSRLS